MNEQLEESLRKEQHAVAVLREKQIILDYLEKKVFEKKLSLPFVPESTSLPDRSKFILPDMTPIFRPFSRPPAHYQAELNCNSSEQQRNRSVQSPSNYHQAKRQAERGDEPIDCRKRRCIPSVTSTLHLERQGSDTSPIVIEEVFPELSGMCKPYVRICVVGGTKSFFCVHPSCNGRELNGNVWRKHYTSHFPEPDCRSPYQCPKCRMGFELYRPLSKHFPACGVDEFPPNQ